MSMDLLLLGRWSSARAPTTMGTSGSARRRSVPSGIRRSRPGLCTADRLVEESAKEGPIRPRHDPHRARGIVFRRSCSKTVGHRWRGSHPLHEKKRRKTGFLEHFEEVHNRFRRPIPHRQSRAGPLPGLPTELAERKSTLHHLEFFLEDFQVAAGEKKVLKPHAVIGQTPKDEEVTNDSSKLAGDKSPRTRG